MKSLYVALAALALSACDLASGPQDAAVIMPAITVETQPAQGAADQAVSATASAPGAMVTVN